MSDDRTTGLYGKYRVERNDGSSEPGGKHEDCVYFVLDLDHDKHARAALAAYAESCRKEYPMLALDLRNILSGPHSCNCRSAGECRHPNVAIGDHWPTFGAPRP